MLSSSTRTFQWMAGGALLLSASVDARLGGEIGAEEEGTDRAAAVVADDPRALPDEEAADIFGLDWTAEIDGRLYHDGDGNDPPEDDNEPVRELKGGKNTNNNKQKQNNNQKQDKDKDKDKQRENTSQYSAQQKKASSGYYPCSGGWGPGQVFNAGGYTFNSCDECLALASPADFAKYCPNKFRPACGGTCATNRGQCNKNVNGRMVAAATAADGTNVPLTTLREKRNLQGNEFWVWGPSGALGYPACWDQRL